MDLRQKISVLPETDTAVRIHLIFLRDRGQGNHEDPCLERLVAFFAIREEQYDQSADNVRNNGSHMQRMPYAVAVP